MHIRLIILFSFFTINSFAYTDSTRLELTNLMKTRAELFKVYSNSLNQKSGIFGNRTKNDLKQSHDQLRSIVEEDNKIMEALGRTLSYRTFEKSTMNYDVNDYLFRIQNLTTVNDTLLRQSQLLQTENKLIKSELGRYRFYNTALIVLGIILAGWGILIWRSKSN